MSIFIITLSKNNKIIPLNPIKTPKDFEKDNFSSFVKKCSIKANKFQSGFIYQYAFVMLLGFSALLTFLIVN